MAVTLSMRHTVVACDACNGGSLLDDEYLRSYFALRVEETPTEALTKVRESARRVFTDPKKGGVCRKPSLVP